MSQMSSVKTYLLAPSFSFPPHGPIAIGNIIADPFRPRRVLTSLDPNQPKPAIETVVDPDYIISRDGGHGVEVGVWAQFLQTVGINLGGQYEKGVITDYKMDAIETSYLKSDPTDEEVNKRVKAPRVQIAIKSGLFGYQPVYMISGVKVARGLIASKEVAANRGGNLGGSLPLSGEVSLGSDVKISTRNTEREVFRVEGDRVFAYQLMKIAQKGWKEKTVTIDDFYPKAAFLGIDSEDQDDEQLGEMKAAPTNAADLPEENREQLSLKMTEVQEGEGKCVCISFDDL